MSAELTIYLEMNQAVQAIDDALYKLDVLLRLSVLREQDEADIARMDSESLYSGE